MSDPGRHPLWCSANSEPEPHELDEDGTYYHWRTIGGSFLPEVRRFPGKVTRPHLGSWEVEIIQEMPAKTDEVVDDPTVVLAFTGGTEGRREFTLLSGEARDIAAALNRAADLERFGS